MKFSSNVHQDIPRINNNRYSVITRLGSGGFCEVVKALDKQTSMTVAIKILDKSKPIFQKGKEDIIDRKLRVLMKREADIMKQLIHPNIVQFYDIYDDPLECFLVLELVNGGELYDRISRDKKIPEEETIEIVIQLLNAVKFMHDKGFVHRDIKPENILFEDNNGKSVLKLADMGLSRKIESVMFTNCGTIDYCAPELLLNRIERNGYGKEVDIWSIGVVVYVMLSGYQPFMTVTQNDEDLRQEIINVHYKFHKSYWSNITITARKFISSILKADPLKRATLDSLMEHEWIQGKRGAVSKGMFSSKYEVSCLVASAILEFVNYIPAMKKP